MAIERQEWGWLGAGLAAALILHAAASSDVWGIVGRAPASMKSQEYSARRIQEAFSGLPVDSVRAALREWLPDDEPVALAAKIATQEDPRQRVTEGLYPRRIDPTAPYTIDVIPTAEARDRRVLATTASGYAVILVGHFGDRLRAAGGGNAELNQGSLWSSGFRRLFPDAAIHFLGILGLGWLSLFAFTRGRPTSERLAASAVAGTCIVGTIASIATWLQIPLLSGWFPLLGFLAIVALFYYWEGRGMAIARAPWESWGFALLLLVFSWASICTPIEGWDGRSIWLLRAKQLFAGGMLARADFASPELRFSHPEYPLAFPALMRGLAGHSGEFRERMAAIAIPFLTVATFTLLWQWSRRRLGRLEGSALTLAIFFTAAGLCARGYVDGYVVALLAILFLAWGEPGGTPIAFVAAACAALLKQEGFVFGFLVFLAGAWARRRSIRRAEIACLAAAFLPAALHFLWRWSEGLTGDFGGGPSGLSLAERWDRIRTIAEVGAGVAWGVPLVVEGTIALGIAVVLAPAVRGEPRPFDAARAASLGLAFVAATVFILSMSTRPLEWITRTSADRLLLHPMALFLIALFALVASRSRADASFTAAP